jgi:pantoate--beta-alanine ligase
MVSPPFIVRTVEELRKFTRGWRTNGNKTAIVPTMGALHQGHLALVREAFRRADKVVVSIFVNPKQFGRGEDLSRYPRNETADREMLAGAGVNLIFAPSPQAIYPPGFATTLTLAGPANVGLEDKFRPQFLAGVATVVAKLLISAECDFAMFGEKDYQQLKLVSQLVRDLNIATEIVPVPILREADGLAMSSRNAYLSSAQRAKAPGLNTALSKAAAAIRAGKTPPQASATARRTLESLGFRVDYLTARNAETLKPVKSVSEPIRILAAVRLGKTRLIDNVPV